MAAFFERHYIPIPTVRFLICINFFAGVLKTSPNVIVTSRIGHLAAFYTNITTFFKRHKAIATGASSAFGTKRHKNN